MSVSDSVPAISVIIPVFNRAHCVADAIESVLAQSRRDFECIVVDDGSTDGTGRVLAGYEGRIKVLTQTNSGVSAARNRGVTAARGRWIAFLDSDDVWLPEKLALQQREVSAQPDAVAHMVDAHLVDAGGKCESLFALRGFKSKFERQPFRERPLADVLEVQFFTPTWMVRKDIFVAAGGFDAGVTLFEDFDLLTRIALAGPFLVSAQVGVRVFRRAGGAEALSLQYQQKRGVALENLARVYGRLLKDPRLTLEEHRDVRKRMGGVRCEQALHCRRTAGVAAGLKVLGRSIAEDPGPWAALRAVLMFCGAGGVLRRARALRQGSITVRRSESELYS